MYFASRLQAGRMLASQIAPKYRYENCAVVALNDGGVVIGAQIAMQLHCIITLLLSKNIQLPRENDSIAGITASGNFAFNKQYTDSEIDEMVSEYHGLIEEEKLNQLHSLNRSTNNQPLIEPRLLMHRNVILVSDGLQNSMELDLALEYLKPINIEKLIVATPLASVPVIDKIHIMADAVFCLSVIEDYISTDHYYDQRDIPNHQKIIDTIENIVLHWIW